MPSVKILNANNEWEYAAASGSGETQELLDQHIANKNNPHKVTAEQIGAATVEYVNNAIESLYGADAPVEGEESLSVREIANNEAASVVSTQELITVDDIDEICGAK